MLWFLFFLAIFIWAFGLKDAIKIALFTGVGIIVLLFLLVIFG